jgi:hypothetical protein
MPEDHTIALDPERRRALLGAKLGALVSEHWPSAASGEPTRPATTFLRGAALAAGQTGWVLVEHQPHRALGPALAWARQADVRELHVLVERDAGVLARRATAFDRAPAIWQIDERTLTPAGPHPFAEPLTPSAEALAAADVLREGGVDVVIEHGEVVGEIMGLEMARVVVDEHGARVEVGVGRHDREAFAMMHGDVPTSQALAAVVDTVRRHRAVGAPPHPLNRLAAEQWLRWRLIADPSTVGASELRAVEGTVPRSNVKDAVPAAAVGTDADGGSVVVVCSTGIDLDLVPLAADVRMAHAPGARLVLVVPERDAHAVTRALAAALVEPAELVALPADWHR